MKLFWRNETVREMVTNQRPISFTHVRNPWDRIWSTYKGKIITGSIRGSLNSTKEEPPSFAEFVDYAASWPNKNEHWQPFSSRCLITPDDQGNVYRYDYILRMEDKNFEQDLLNIFRQAGLHQFSTMNNAVFYNTEHSLAARREFYAVEARRGGLTLSELVEKVYQIYRDDIERFNYSFEAYY